MRLTGGQILAHYLDAGATKTGWWDVPVPTYHLERRRQYEAERAEEQLL